MPGTDQVTGSLKVKHLECHSEGGQENKPFSFWRQGKRDMLWSWPRQEGSKRSLPRTDICRGELPVQPAGLFSPAMLCTPPPDRNSPRRSASPNTQATTAATSRHGATTITQRESTVQDLAWNDLEEEALCSEFALFTWKATPGKL